MRRTITVLLVIWLAGCQTPMQSGSTCTVPEGYLAATNTLTWRKDGLQIVDDTGFVSPMVVEGLRAGVEQLLRTKGFEVVEAGDASASDVEIAVTLRTRRELVSLVVNESPCNHTDCWERIDMGSSTRMDVQTIGFLTADVYQAGDPIWHGWVERNLYPKDRDDPESVIQEALPALFSSFPP